MTFSGVDFGEANVYNGVLLKKKLILTLLLLVGVILGYLSFLFLLLGFLTAKLLGAKRDGEPSRIKSIILPLGKYKLHLHHWLICLACGILGVVKGVYFVSPEVFGGILGGLAYHGIYCYNDWHRIILAPKKLS